ncbi:MAG: alkaline phosphatase [Clostridia bacterium]|nr:alkaline phosphatase [Clostridia bacterium]
MKKLLALLLSLILVFSFTACGDNSGDAQNETNSAVTAVTHNGWYTEGDITITKDQVDEIVNQEYTTPKNVIVIIGDGMGPNDITLAEENVKGVYDFGLVLNRIKNHGLATTHSANADVTDSAASGTALATGSKTNNGYIGKDVNGNDLKNMAEIARENGKKIGIITDEDLPGATPTAFTVHNISRDNRKELANDMVKFKPDVLMCKDYMGVFALLDADTQKIFNDEYLVAKDFKRYKDVLDTDKENKKPFFGFLDGYSPVATYNLAHCAEVAFERLENDKGFFLMIESAGTDKFGHDNNMNGKLQSVVTLDRTVAAALKFMKDNPDTLLLITSDHETGGVKLPEGDNYKLNELLTQNSHTDTPVRVFAVGKGSEYFKDKTVDNTDIAKFLISDIDGE